MKSTNLISPVAKVIAALTAITFIGLGVAYITTEYVPAGWTKHGYVQAINGNNAVMFGVIMILIGFLPLLLFAKNAHHVAILGTALGMTILVAIFILVYVR